MIAHIGGLPVEEVIAQLASAGVAVLIVVSLARERPRRWATHLGRRSAYSRRSPRE